MWLSMALKLYLCLPNVETAHMHGCVWLHCYFSMGDTGWPGLELPLFLNFQVSGFEVEEAL